MTRNSRYTTRNRSVFTAAYLVLLAAAFAYPLAVLMGA
jgi:hypothetical protein